MRIVTLDPFRCRMWHLHDRLEEHINEASCSTEIRSFDQQGQLIPVLGRSVTDDPEHDVEIVCGARRLFVARHMRKPLLVELRELSDREAILAMDMENRQRQDLSPYERGLSYARWLRAGYFGSQEELAEALSTSASQVSRLLKLARLPSVIVNAFDSAVEICEGWGLTLVDLLEDSETRTRAIQKARSLGGAPRPPAREVYRQLLASTSRGRKVRATHHDTVIRSAEGVPLFRIRQQRSNVSIILPLDRVSARTLDNIKKSVAEIMEGSPRTHRYSRHSAADLGTVSSPGLQYASG